MPALHIRTGTAPGNGAVKLGRHTEGCINNHRLRWFAKHLLHPFTAHLDALGCPRDRQAGSRCMDAFIAALAVLAYPNTS
jgi:hypothetical protein